MTEKQIYEYIVEHCPYCALCGSTQNLHIHHILYRSEGGPTSLWNLIRLCEKCHTKVHSSKRYWPIVFFFSGIFGFGIRVMVAS